ncbi:MAG TPA: type II secretion system F family protein, partial [Candidatus Binatia bacterium]|nr:type II secretion system F family protein [Candidatus Binatia bacterium]
LVRPREPRRPGRLGALLGGTGLVDRLATLSVQAGYSGAPGDVLLAMAALAAAAGAAAGLRTGGLVWGLLVAVMAGALPVVYLLYRRRRRLALFETQLPDGLDMITRALRAGNALSSAIKLVGDEMPDPIGAEFRRVEEEIRLGVDPGDALAGLQQRVPTDDVRFFCTAIRIQRGTGGNLAEVLERLAEVVRERFKVLSYARVLSSQHRWTAVLVGLSPIVFGIVFQLLNPGFFEPLFKDPLGPTLILGGLVFEALGFYMVWRIARIKV